MGVNSCGYCTGYRLVDFIVLFLVLALASDADLGTGTIMTLTYIFTSQLRNKIFKFV